MARTQAVCGLVGVMLAAGLTGCSSEPATPSITVFAAASLQPAFTEIAEQFKTDNPGVAVAFNFAGSSDLATQLTQGARADVFASANTTQMDKVVQAGLLDDAAVPFATNTLVIVTAPGNPHRVRSFADLAVPGLAVVVCQSPVPCGAATHKVEQATGVAVKPVSEEPDVTDVLNKVTTGQADSRRRLPHRCAAQPATRWPPSNSPRPMRRGQHLPDRAAAGSAVARAGPRVRRPGHRRGGAEGAARGRFR